jgi:hypothetical protein
MAVNCGVSFGLCVVRVTKVDGAGNVVAPPDNNYITDKPISITLTPNIETGNTFSLRNGCGCSIARFKANDIFNWFEFTFASGALEPEMQAMMLGADPITDTGDVVGLAFQGSLECDEDEPAVALEFWTKHIVGSGQDGIHPFVHWVFPKTVWQLSDNTFEEDIAQPSVTGFSRTNAQWGDGPYAGEGPPEPFQDISEGAYWKTDVDPPSAACAAGDVTPSS